MRNIGEKVWVSKAARTPVRKLCPDCLGTARWHCVLPCGEEFDVECPRCYHGGYEPSDGIVSEDYEVSVTVLRTTINRIEIRDGKPQYGTEDGCGFSDEQVHGTEEAAQAEGRERAKAWCAAEDAAMKEQARKKGRPRRKSDGSREANPMEFGGGSANYARNTIRDALKTAVKWVEFAKRHGTEIDLHQMVDAALRQPNEKDF